MGWAVACWQLSWSCVFWFRPPLLIEESDLKLGDSLGTGGFSVVYRGTWLCTPVAVKKWFKSAASKAQQLEIRGEIMTNAVGIRHRAAERVLGHEWVWQCSMRCGHEHAVAMQGLRHPNIVMFCGACLEGPNTFMVSELLPFSLLQVLYDMSNIPLPLIKCINIALDISRAFCYLHSRVPQVIHR